MTIVMKKDIQVEKKIDLIGYASGWGAQIRGTEKAPHVLSDISIEHTLQKKGFKISWCDLLEPSHYSDQKEIAPGLDTLPVLLPHLTDLAHQVEESLHNGNFPCVLGGDHAMAMGTFSGAKNFVGEGNEFGLIWVDAHMDAHTPETSPSNAFHGMPVATLLGHGHPDLISILNEHPTIKPENIVLIGIRSYEPGEYELLTKLGVKIYYIQEVFDRGFDAVIKETLELVTKNTKAFGLTIDLDAFDPEFAPGVGSPELKGLNPKKMLPYLKNIQQHPEFSILEITEFNPELDEDKKTETLIQNLMEALLPL